jgi:hypothetical protein
MSTSSSVAARHGWRAVATSSLLFGCGQTPRCVHLRQKNALAFRANEAGLAHYRRSPHAPGPPSPGTPTRIDTPRRLPSARPSKTLRRNPYAQSAKQSPRQCLPSPPDPASSKADPPAAGPPALTAKCIFPPQPVRPENHLPVPRHPAHQARTTVLIAPAATPAPRETALAPARPRQPGTPPRAKPHPPAATRAPREAARCPRRISARSAPSAVDLPSYPARPSRRRAPAHTRPPSSPRHIHAANRDTVLSHSPNRAERPPRRRSSR